jgi:3-methyl-2-oxobutanoate hydroxymethyltransferase
VKLTVGELHAMKREGRKIAAVVCWDSNTAGLADAAGVDVVSIGDSAAVSFEELLVYCRAVARSVSRALVSCDLPEPTVENGRQLVDAGADLVKVEVGFAELTAAGIAVFAQVESTADARAAAAAGAVLIDFRNAPRDAAAAVPIPVLGGLGGGPWLDGRIRAVHRLLDEPLAVYVGDVRAGRAVQGD